MHIYIYLNKMMIETTSLPLQTHSIYPVTVFASAYLFSKMAAVTAITDAIYLWFGATYNALMHTSGHSPAYKIEEQINFDLRYARLYLAESYDKLDNKSAAANTFDISFVVKYSRQIGFNQIITIKWWYCGLRKLLNDGNRRWRYKNLWRAIHVTQLVIMLK